MVKSIKLVVSLFLLLLAAGTSHAQPSAEGVRDIDNQNLNPGQSTNVTVTITSTLDKALAFHESLPAGWTLTRISDDANFFKSSTNEWVWFESGMGKKTIIYRLIVPSNATPATYTIQGNLIISNNSSGTIGSVTSSVTGKNSIVVSGVAQTASPQKSSPQIEPSPPPVKSSIGSALLKMDVRVNPAKPMVGDNISLKAELIYPVAGYIVEFGKASVKDKTISVYITARPPEGVAAQVITTYSHVYEIGYSGAGSYAYEINLNGAPREKGSFEVEAASVKTTESVPAPGKTLPVEPVKKAVRTPGFTFPLVVILFSYMLFKFTLM